MKKINPNNLPKRSQKTFYNFVMTSLLPSILRLWSAMGGQEKYFFNKPGFYKWYIFRAQLYLHNREFLKAIIMIILAIYQKEKFGK